MAYTRRSRRSYYGVRGLGQTDSGDVCDPASSSYDSLECSNQGGGPVATPPASGPLLFPQNPLAPVAPSTGPLVIGAAGPCASGYVVGDGSGNCVPASTLASTIATPGGAAALGLTPQQAAAITASLNAANTAVKIATGQLPPVYVAPVSTNPFANISSTTLLIGAAAIAALLLLTSRKR